jgi:hypothetical protein
MWIRLGLSWMNVTPLYVFKIFFSLLYKFNFEQKKKYTEMNF